MQIAESNFLSSIKVFAKIDSTYLSDNIVAYSRLVTYQSEEVIFTSNDIACKLYVVKSGWVRLYGNSSDGKEVTNALYTAGSFFDVTAISREDHVYNFSCQALEASELIEIPLNVIKAAVAKSHLLALELLSHMSLEVNISNRRNEHLCIMTTSQRIGCFLLQLCHDQISENIVVKLPVKKGIVANYLGMNFETFSRALQKLKNIGIESKGDTIVIHDIKQVEKYVCSSCSGEKNDQICSI